MITTEGKNHLLNVALGIEPKPAGYYLALFAGSAAPSANWTAANFAAVANEIVSQSEGYTAAARPLWKPEAAADGSIGNFGGKGVGDAAAVTIATASSITATGVALLSAPAKGATTGVLVSAVKFPVPRVFQNGDVFYMGFRLSLTE